MENTGCFSYRDGQLYTEDVPLRVIAAAAGTPVYIYSQTELTQRAAAYHDSLAAISPQGQVCFATKANSNPTLLRWLAGLGLGADVTSGGELFLALQAGFSPDKILFSGVGKRREEIELALDNNIHALQVESAQEFDLIGQIAAARQQAAPISFRLNPDVASETHPYISTGTKAHKFGLAAEEIRRLAPTAAAHPWLHLKGLAAHIGSQITRLEPFTQAVQLVLALAAQLKSQGISLSYLNVGGGLGIKYAEAETQDFSPPTIADWVQTVARPVAAAGYPVFMEPGRSIVGPAGLLLTHILYTKQQGSHNFVITDAGMTELIRPALYQAHHPIVPVLPRAGTPQTVDIVGPVCETGDVLGRNRTLPPLQPGDYLAILQAGAYGFVMSSNYNGRLRPAEVWVNGSKWQIIRPRQTWQQLEA
ncbi:MAG: diaminopimelate decarboxylase [Anaerolineae bacterium]|nr:diaminopimelate decarboxylase [Anaerolineae bacterium]